MYHFGRVCGVTHGRCPGGFAYATVPRLPSSSTRGLFLRGGLATAEEQEQEEVHSQCTELGFGQDEAGEPPRRSCYGSPIPRVRVMGARALALKGIYSMPCASRQSGQQV